MGIKKVLTAVETAKQDEDMPGRFARVMSQAIAAAGFTDGRNGL